jgi:hypothetical protein
MRVFATAVKIRHYQADSRCRVEIVYCLVSNFTDSHISLHILDLFAMPSQYEPPEFTKSFQTPLASIAQFGGSHSSSPPFISLCALRSTGYPNCQSQNVYYMVEIWGPGLRVTLFPCVPNPTNRRPPLCCPPCNTGWTIEGVLGPGLWIGLFPHVPNFPNPPPNGSSPAIHRLQGVTYLQFMFPVSLLCFISFQTAELSND